MDLVLLFFAIPLAVIVLSIVLQKILNCPWLVAATFFVIFLIITFAIENLSLLIFAIAYTIIAFITAWIIKIICRICQEGITLRNINTQNINTRRVNTNSLRISRDNNEDNNESNSCCNGRINGRSSNNCVWNCTCNNGRNGNEPSGNNNYVCNCNNGRNNNCNENQYRNRIF